MPTQPETYESNVQFCITYLNQLNEQYSHAPEVLFQSNTLPKKLLDLSDKKYSRDYINGKTLIDRAIEISLNVISNQNQGELELKLLTAISDLKNTKERQNNINEQSFNNF